MSNQLKVTITNNTNTTKLLSWLPKGSLCLTPKGSIIIDYEPWSTLNEYTRPAMRIALSSGAISLTMHVMDLDGTQHDIPYNPCKEGAGLSVGKKQAAPAPKTIVAEPPMDEKTHIVVTGTDNASELPFNLTPVIPPEAADRDTPKTGFVASNNTGETGVVVDNSNADYLVAKKEEVVEEPKADRDYRSEFNELVSQKKWTEALELLIEQFGKDKVTFSARTIMTLKDYDEIVTRKINQ